MSKCPYTWFRGLFSSTDLSGISAKALRVKVVRDQATVVDVSLPARSAGWLIDLIPQDVVSKIRSEGIPIDAIQYELAAQGNEPKPQRIFELIEEARKVEVWLE